MFSSSSMYFHMTHANSSRVGHFYTRRVEELENFLWISNLFGLWPLLVSINLPRKWWDSVWLTPSWPRSSGWQYYWARFPNSLESNRYTCLRPRTLATTMDKCWPQLSAWETCQYIGWSILARLASRVPFPLLLKVVDFEYAVTALDSDPHFFLDPSGGQIPLRTRLLTALLLRARFWARRAEREQQGTITPVRHHWMVQAPRS